MPRRRRTSPTTIAAAVVLSGLAACGGPDTPRGPYRTWRDYGGSDRGRTRLQELGRGDVSDKAL
jgi:hypothetical protein